MRLIRIDARGNLSLTRDLFEDIPPYAILSHTWGSDDDEVTYAEMCARTGRGKAGFKKIEFCAKQAQKDGLQHCWVDTCCIDKHNAVELQEAITSMFRWYARSRKCYVYLADVSTIGKLNRSEEPVRKKNKNRKRDSLLEELRRQTQSLAIFSLQPEDSHRMNIDWKPQFMASRWFTRGWTLQELIAPVLVEFYSADELLLGTRQEFLSLLHNITRVPLTVLDGAAISQVSIEERMKWAELRNTKKPEDKAYCLLGLFGVSMPLIYGEGEEEAHRRLTAVIEEKIGIHKPIHEHWLVLRPPNPAFTGRDTLLQDLQESISRSVRTLWNPRGARIVVWGLGGQGKSELCLQLALRLRELFWAVMWIDMSTVQIAENGFIHAAQKLGQTVKEWKSALNIIANLKKPWLLILDNADDLDIDYQHYFPESRFGIVIMTTRNEECQQYAIDNTIALDGLPILEAQDLLLKTTRLPVQDHDDPSEDAQKVADLLHSHPLALTQAGAYIAQGRCTLAEYPLKYEAQRSCLLTFRTRQVRSRYQDVYATFEISAEMLGEMKTPASDDALELLRFLAFCGSSRLPLFVFEKAWQKAKEIPCDRADDARDIFGGLYTPWHVRRLPSVCDTKNGQWHGDKLFDAIHLLQNCSLVYLSLYDDLQFLSLHPLVYAWARDRQDAVQKQQAWTSVGCALALLSNEEDNLTFRQRISLPAHILSFITWDFTELLSSRSHTQVTSILLRCGWILSQMGYSSPVLGFTNRLFEDLGMDWKAVKSSYLNLYNLHRESLKQYGAIKFNLALSCKKMSDWNEAEHLLAPLMQVMSEHFEAEDSHLTLVQGELAVVYIELDRAGEAIKILEKLLPSLLQRFVEHPRYPLGYELHLARAYAREGRPDEAIDILKDIIQLLKRALPDTYSDLVYYRGLLGRLLFDIGRYEDAVKSKLQVVKAQELTLDAENKTRLSDEHELAIYMWTLGRKQEALDRMAQVVKVKERVLKPEDPGRLSSEYLLVRYMWESGHEEEGLALMRKVAEIEYQSLLPDDPNRLATAKWLAIMERKIQSVLD